MTDEEFHEKMKSFSKHYGEGCDLEKLKEECLELATATSIYKDEQNEKTRHQLVNEMVDVWIMICRAMIALQISDDEWNLYIGFKVKRQELRVQRETNG